MKTKKDHYSLAGLLTMLLVVTASTGPSEARNISIPFDPANFTDPQDNMYLPMTQGLTYVYMAEEEDGLILNEVTQTADTREVLGVRTTVVHDVEWIIVEGEMIKLEETFDWITWDNEGNVWYFGEDSTAFEYDDEWNPLGTTSEGSWEAGIDDAQPGILMLANPRRGDSYHQEFAEDIAEDMGKVLNLGVTVTLKEFVEEEVVYKGCFKTKEWTPLEPGHIEHKYYAPGVGLVQIEGHHGKQVVTELVAIE